MEISSCNNVKAKSDYDVVVENIKKPQQNDDKYDDLLKSYNSRDVKAQYIIASRLDDNVILYVLSSESHGIFVKNC